MGEGRRRKSKKKKGDGNGDEYLHPTSRITLSYLKGINFAFFVFLNPYSKTTTVFTD